MADEGIFAVLDVEATGFSPLTGGRVIDRGRADLSSWGC
jgi:hypothetical protein